MPTADTLAAYFALPAAVTQDSLEEAATDLAIAECRLALAEWREARGHSAAWAAVASAKGSVRWASGRYAALVGLLASATWIGPAYY